MTTSKSAKIAAHLNAQTTDRPYDYRQAAEAEASALNVGLYWIGTASNNNGLPHAEVFQISTKNEWARKLGSITLGHDNVWRA